MITKIGTRFFVTNRDYDVLVIGGGPGGYVATIKAAQKGLRAGCIESRETLGGTCLNVGCIPSKSLLNNSYLYKMAKSDCSKRGIIIDNIKLDLSLMLNSKLDTVSQLTKGIQYLFKKNKADYIKGVGSFIDPNRIQVTYKSKKHIYTAKNIIIATGSVSTGFPGVEVDEKDIVSSTGALSFEQVPKHLMVIGGGVIGLELGSVWARLGSKVTVIEYADNIGSQMDLKTSKTFQTILQKQGLDIRTGTKVTGISKTNGTCTLNIECVKSKNTNTIVGDKVLLAIGRKPYTSELGLDKLNIKLNPRGYICTDRYLRTDHKNIFAIGDVIDGPMLAHKAEEEGCYVVDVISKGLEDGHPIDHSIIPSVIYTHPEVAWVGQTEESLKKSNVSYTVGEFPFFANSRAKTNEDILGSVKILTSPETGLMLGAHIIGANAGEMISEAVLALASKTKVIDIGSLVHAHPSLSEAFKEACMISSGSKAIHI